MQIYTYILTIISSIIILNKLNYENKLINTIIILLIIILMYNIILYNIDLYIKEYIYKNNNITKDSIEITHNSTNEVLISFTCFIVSLIIKIWLIKS